MTNNTKQTNYLEWEGDERTDSLGTTQSAFIHLDDKPTVEIYYHATDKIWSVHNSEDNKLIGSGTGDNHADSIDTAKGFIEEYAKKLGD